MQFVARVALLLSAGIGLAQEPSSRGVNFYSVEREKQIGQALAARLESGLPIAHEPKLDAWVAHVGAMLAKYANSPFDYRFVLYEDRRPGGPAMPDDFASPPVGAMAPLDALRGHTAEPLAVAGGPIFVPMSLLAGAPDEAVFAFQLAHAMAHIVLRHPTRLATKLELVQTAAVEDRHDERLQLGTLPLSRAFEREADYLAAEILSKAGYSPEPMATYLRGQPVPQGLKVFTARPMPGERAAAIQDEVEKLQLLPADHSALAGFAEAKALASAVR
jgi:predicted Zn-dependent protease